MSSTYQLTLTEGVESYTLRDFMAISLQNYQPVTASMKVIDG
jgi:hypothetical protein